MRKKQKTNKTEIVWTNALVILFIELKTFSGNVDKHYVLIFPNTHLIKGILLFYRKSTK